MGRSETYHRKLVAIMFTDMVGYTVLVQKDESAALEVLEEHRCFLRCIFRKHQGIEIKTIGDGFLVQFASAVGAMHCALEIQKKLSKTPERFQLRIGIHLGDVVEREGDLYGDGVNLASRLESLAEPGGICLSQQVFDQVQRLIQEPITRLEGVELKHIPKPLNLYRISFSARSRKVAPARTAPERKSVAVLPFVNRTPDRENEFLSDGITEDIIAALSQVEGLRVPASTSVFAFKGEMRDVRRIGKQLGVAAVLEGSLRRSGNKLRITAKLINVSDGCNLWCEQFNREMSDVFAIQDEISKAIVQALKLRLISERDAPMVKPPTESMDAYELYLKGRHFWTQRGEGLKKGLHYFELALLEDANYALAHAGLADSYLLLGYYGYLPPKEVFPRAKAAALKCLELNPGLGEGHCSLAYATFLYDWDALTADREFTKAIELNPGHLTTHYWYASCLVGMGRNEEALAADAQAMKKDPFSVLTNAHYAWTLVALRRYDDALVQLQKTLGLDPAFAIAHRLLGQSLVHLGRHKQAIEAFEKAVLLSKGNPAMLAWLAYGCGAAGRERQGKKAFAELKQLAQGTHVRSLLLALAAIGLGDTEEAILSLQRAFAERDFWMQWLAVDAAFDPLHDDPHFLELLKKIADKRAEAASSRRDGTHGSARKVPPQRPNSRNSRANTKFVPAFLPASNSLLTEPAPK